MVVQSKRKDPAHLQKVLCLLIFFSRTMVEIKPYIDDDDEDQSNWVPLTASSPKPITNKYVGNNMSSEAAAADDAYANQKTCGVVSDLSINSNMNQSDDNVPRTYVSKGSQDSLVLLENIHDDSEGEEEDDDGDIVVIRK